MDTQNQDPNFNTPRHNGRVYGGLFLLAIGAIFFLKQADFFFFPNWLFSWPMILIAVGVFTGLKHNFRGAGWLIPIIIGVIFLVDRFDIGLDLHRFIFPAILICIGLSLILRPKRGGGWDNWGGRGRYRRNRNYGQQDYTGNTGNAGNPQQPTTFTDTQGKDYIKADYYTSHKEDFVDITSVLGSTQRIVVSKNFKGGDITCFMGGAEINLTQADITGSVVIDITTVMGGAKLIVPPNWEIKSEISTVMGGVEDKRQVQGKIIDFNKVLVLKGTAFMGGIELRSF
jgi:predicted membrane protein